MDTVEPMMMMRSMNVRTCRDAYKTNNRPKRVRLFRPASEWSGKSLMCKVDTGE